MNVYSYDPITIIAVTIVVTVFAVSTTWDSVKDYREWRKKKYYQNLASKTA